MFLSSQDFKNKVYNSFNFPSLFNLSVEWNLGYILMTLCVLQIITGVLMTLFFKVGFTSCLESKSFLIKEMEFGWILSYIHMILPSFMFFLMFFHIFKSLYYPVFTYSLIWVSGFSMLFLFMLISFTGYGLVGGSLGFWAMMVFMGMVEFLFGETISFIIFSDFGSLSDLILFKVFTYHFLMPIMVLALMFLHLYIVHLQGSSYGVYSSYMDFFGFMVTSYMKDNLFSLLVDSMLMYFLGFSIEEFFSMDNFLELKMDSVPEEMNSEWYLSLVFILLSSVYSKQLGMFLVFLNLIIFFGKFYFSNMLGESVLSHWFTFYSMILVWLLMVFTLLKHGGSFYMTSFFLFSLLGFLDYLLFSVKSTFYHLDF